MDCPDQDVVTIENSKLKQQIRILNGRLISMTEVKPDTASIPCKGYRNNYNIRQG